jgi:hypothetical protein
MDLNQLQYQRAQQQLAAQTGLAELAPRLQQARMAPALQNLQTQMGLAQFAPQLQQQQLATAAQALQAQAGLQGQALEPFQAALSLAQAQANARIGAGSNVAALTSRTNFAAPYQAAANLALGIGERLGGGGVPGYAGGTFGGGLSGAFGQSPSYMQQTPSNPFNLSFGI